MEIYKKLAQARNFIKASPLKKAGRNKYSEYDYFTPEQINALVHQAETETGLIHLFNLEREQLGMVGRLMILNIEDPSEVIVFTQATDIPQIKATNISQQIGGAVTYTLRYMLMTAFDIADNSLDFDAKDNREEKPKVKKIMPDDRFAKMCDALRTAESKKKASDIHLQASGVFSFDDKQTEIINQIIDNHDSNICDASEVNIY